MLNTPIFVPLTLTDGCHIRIRLSDIISYESIDATNTGSAVTLFDYDNGEFSDKVVAIGVKQSVEEIDKAIHNTTFGLSDF